jgi:hypothetical protein
LAEALQAIHDCGLIHRDLKPGNIIMADDGPRVLDFGIARALESTRLTSTGATFGTPGFLAPEQAQGLEVGGAADVFALGAVLIAAAGGRAFGEGTPMMLMYRAVHEPADLSALPEGVRPVVAACLAKDPPQRPTPEELLDLLAPGTAGEPTAEVPAQPPVPASSSAPSAPSAPTPSAMSAGAPNAGSIADAATVTATAHAVSQPGFPQQPTSSGKTNTAPLGKMSTGRAAAVVAGALLVLGGAGYGVYASGGPGWGSDASFPSATHELVIPETLVDDAYGREIENRLPAVPQPDTSDRKGSTHYIADYTSTGTSSDKVATFRTVHVYGSSGRYKDPEGDRDELIRAVTVTNSETVSDPPKTIRVPGADVDFRCTTVDHQTVCGWGDDNTTVAIAFTPTGSLEAAAAETRKIRDDIRKPITQQP